MYVLRFAEIGSEPKPVKSKIRSDIEDVLRRDAKGVRVRSLGTGRLLVDGDGDLGDVLARLHGVASWSPCTTCSLGELDDVVVDVAKRVLRPGARFRVKVRRTGEHPFRSPEKATWLGARIVDAIPGAAVDLRTPERTLLIEIIGDACVVSGDVVPGRDAKPEERESPRSGPPRFVVDHMLGTLARRLRTLGIDTAYHRDTADAFLLRVAEDEGRVLLTRDAPLARTGGNSTYFVNATDLEEQVDEVLRAFDLHPDESDLFSRCTICNTPVVPIAKDAAKDRIPPRVYAALDEFSECPTCRRIYWKGTHYRDVAKRLSRNIG